METVISINQKLIRLTDERWNHIITGHQDIQGLKENVMNAVSDPDYVFLGNEEELLAVKKNAAEKFLVVVYRELTDDGFIITAFQTKRIQSLFKRKLLWQKSS